MDEEDRNDQTKQRCGGHRTRRDSDASSWYYLYSSARGPAFRAECETLKVRVLTPVTLVALRDMGVVDLLAEGGMYACILLPFCKHIIITLLASGARSPLYPAYSTRTRNLIKLSGASPSAPSRAAAIFRRTI